MIDNVTVVAVTKMQSCAAIQQVYAAGYRDFGENYLSEALPKINTLKDLDCTWHYIGNIQSNKCKNLAQYFDVVQTVSSVKILQELNKWNQFFNKSQQILIQIKLLPDANKGGCSCDESIALLEMMSSLPYLRLRGFMTILPLGISEEQQYQAFLKLKNFLDECNQNYHLDMCTLSMGMSDDYQQAIKAGSNMIRLGRAIFGEHREN